MNYKSITTGLQKTFFALSLLIPMISEVSIVHAMPAQPGGMPANLEKMTPEEIAQWEKQLDQEIQAFVKTLPPEQQEQFHKDVEELTKVMENMSEEELMEFVGSVLSEQPQAPAPKPAQPKPQAPAQKAQPKPQATVAPKQPTINAKELEARALLESIIHHIRKLTQKIHSDPALAANLQDWGRNKEIDGWQATTTWNGFKIELEKFEQLCNKLIEQDKKTLAYLHLPTLIDAEHVSLYNNLQRMNTLLSREIPDIIIPELGLQKISPESKRALKKSVGACAEAFYVLKVPAAIEELLKKYDPTAQKLKESAEKSRQSAIESSKKVQPKAPTRVAGSSKQPTPTGRASRPSMSSGGGYRAGSSGSSRPAYKQNYAPAYDSSSASRPSSGAGGSRPETHAKSGAGKSPVNESETFSGEKKKDSESGTASITPGQTPNAEPDRKVKAANRDVDSFGDAIDEVKKFADKNSNLYVSKPFGDLINKSYDELYKVNKRVLDLKGKPKSDVINEVKKIFDTVKNTLVHTSKIIAEHYSTNPVAIEIKNAIASLQKGVDNLEGPFTPRAQKPVATPVAAAEKEEEETPTTAPAVIAPAAVTPKVTAPVASPTVPTPSPVVPASVTPAPAASAPTIPPAPALPKGDIKEEIKTKTQRTIDLTGWEDLKVE